MIDPSKFIDLRPLWKFAFKDFKNRIRGIILYYRGLTIDDIECCNYNDAKPPWLFLVILLGFILAATSCVAATYIYHNEIPFFIFTVWANTGFFLLLFRKKNGHNPNINTRLMVLSLVATVYAILVVLNISYRDTLLFFFSTIILAIAFSRIIYNYQDFRLPEQNIFLDLIFLISVISALLYSIVALKDIFSNYFNLLLELPKQVETILFYISYYFEIQQIYFNPLIICIGILILSRALIVARGLFKIYSLVLPRVHVGNVNTSNAVLSSLLIKAFIIPFIKGINGLISFASLVCGTFWETLKNTGIFILENFMGIYLIFQSIVIIYFIVLKELLVYFPILLGFYFAYYLSSYLAMTQGINIAFFVVFNLLFMILILLSHMFANRSILTTILYHFTGNFIYFIVLTYLIVAGLVSLILGGFFGIPAFIPGINFLITLLVLVFFSILALTFTLYNRSLNYGEQDENSENRDATVVHGFAPLLLPTAIVAFSGVAFFPMELINTLNIKTTRQS